MSTADIAAAFIKKLTTEEWQTAQVGADNLPVYNGSVFAWTYCGETPSYAPTCKP
jgi:hypothetical protein